MSYCKHFGMRIEPFEDRADPQFTFLSPEREETLAALEYEARYGKGPVLLLGEAGTGKTQLIRALLPRLGGGEHAVVVTCPGNGSADLIRDASKGFGVSIATSPSPDGRQLNRLRRHLLRNVKAGHRNILVVDQAENLDASRLDQLRALCDLQGEEEGLLTIIVSAQPRFRDALSHPESERLRQQLFQERQLSPLTPTQTREYVRHRLEVAGAAQATLIDNGALALIHHASGGVPRLINHLCHAALLSGFGAGLKSVGHGVVAELVDARAGAPRDMDASSVLAGRAAALAATTGGMRTSRDRSAGIQRLQGDDETAREGHETLQGPPPIGPVSTWTESPSSMMKAFATDASGTSASPARGVTGSLQRTMETLFDRGALLLERLDLSIARAERMAQSAEGALVQHAAVEKHLESLALSGERVSTELRETIRGGESTLARSVERASRLAQSIDDRADRLDGVLARLGELERGVESRTSSLAESLSRADAIEPRLAELDRAVNERARRIEERVDAMQRRADAHDETVARGHAVIRRAEQLIERLNEIGGDDAEDRLRRTLQEHIHELESTVQKAVDEGRRAAREVEDGIRAAAQEGQDEAWRRETKLAEARDRLAREGTELADRTRKTMEKAVDDVVRRLGEVRDAALSEAESAQKTAIERWKSQWENQRRHAEEKNAAVMEAVQQKCDATAARLEELADDATVVEDRRDHIRQSLDAALDDTREIEQRIQSLEKSARQAEGAVDELSRRAEASSSSLEPLVERAENVIESIQRARGEADVVHENATRSLAELSATTGRVEALCKQVAACDVTVARLATESTKAEGAEERLREAAEQAGKLGSDIRAQVAAAAEASGRISSHVAAATSVHHQLSAITIDAHKLVKQLHESTADARRAADGADKEVTRREEQDKLRAKAMDELVATVAQARTLNDGLQALVFEANDRDGDLRRTAEDAGKIHRELGDVCERGATVLSESRESLRETEAAVRRVEERLAASRDVLSAMESAAGSASTASTEAERIAQTLRQSGQAALDATERVDQAVRLAEEAFAKYRKEAGEADLLVARIDSLADVLRSASDSDASIRETVNEVRAMHDDLLSTLSDVGRQCASLKELAATAQELIGEQERVRNQAQAAVRHWDNHVTTSQAAVESGAALLKEFVEQAESVERHIERLETRAHDVQRAVGDATDRPTKVLKEIREQNERLEKVFAAVRKVFSGLSQTALDARTRNDEMRKTHEATVERLSTLTTQTQRAAGTLREWVEEAVRAQARLERTLHEVPSITQTHSNDALAGLSQTAGLLGRLDRSAALGELRRMPEPAVRATTETDAPPNSMATEPVSAPIGVVAAPKPRRAETGTMESESSDQRAQEIVELVQQAKASRATGKA